MAICLLGASSNRCHGWTHVLPVLILEEEDKEAARTCFHGFSWQRRFRVGRKQGLPGDREREMSRQTTCDSLSRRV